MGDCHRGVSTRIVVDNRQLWLWVRVWRILDWLLHVLDWLLLHVLHRLLLHVLNRLLVDCDVNRLRCLWVDHASHNGLLLLHCGD